MSEERKAKIEIPGLPFRIRCPADVDEAFEIFGRQLNRYLHNHDEHSKEIPEFQIIHAGSMRLISDANVAELAQLTGDNSPSIPMRFALNYIGWLKQEIERAGFEVINDVSRGPHLVRVKGQRE